MCLALSHKWFPSRAVDLDSMAEAVFLETDYWEKDADRRGERHSESL